MRSYVHCPTCDRAHEARETCPRCRKPAHDVAPSHDPVADIIVAATQLARAIARATPTERLAARASLHLVREQISATLARTRPRLLRPQLVAAAAVLIGFVR